MDNVYEAARKRRDELQSELKSLSDFIEMYQRTRHLLGMDSREQTVNSEPDTSALNAPPRESPATLPHDAEPAKRTRVTSNPKPAEVIRGAKEILLEMRRPLSRKELHERLWEHGLEVKGADPVKTLGTILWRAKEDMVSVKDGYWVNGEPLPEYGYDPRYVHVQPSGPQESEGAVGEAF